MKWYEAFFKDREEGASILIPIGALRALERLSNLSREGILVISGDKGNNAPDQFLGLGSFNSIIS